MAKAIHPRTSWDKSYLATCLLRDIGAAAGLLLPKCPLCWMAITGSVVTGAATKFSVEILSLCCSLQGPGIFFVFAFNPRHRRASLLAGPRLQSGQLHGWFTIGS
jgi:hypothetical protein